MFSKTKTDFIETQKQAEKDKQQQEEDNLKLVCKELFTNKNGYYFLRFLKKISLWDKQDVNVNTEILAYEKGRRDIWLIIRNFLPKETLVQVEIYNQDDTN